MNKLILALMLAPLAAFAANTEVSYEAPTEREDGSPLSVSEIGGYSIYENINGSYQPITALNPIPFDAVSVLIPEVTNGIHCYVLTAIDTEGRESMFSNEACDIAKGKPNAPRNIIIKINDGRK